MQLLYDDLMKVQPSRTSVSYTSSQKLYQKDRFTIIKSEAFLLILKAEYVHISILLFSFMMT